MSEQQTKNTLRTRRVFKEWKFFGLQPKSIESKDCLVPRTDHRDGTNQELKCGQNTISKPRQDYLRTKAIVFAAPKIFEDKSL